MFDPNQSMHDNLRANGFDSRKSPQPGKRVIFRVMDGVDVGLMDVFEAGDFLRGMDSKNAKAA